MGDRRSTWWVLAELGRRLGYELATTTGDDATNEARLSRITKRARCSYDQLRSDGYAEAGHDLPAPWVDAHVERMGGWRLAPQLLVDQLAALELDDALVLVPRRQVRHLNSQFDYLGEPAEIMLHPDDAATALISDGLRSSSAARTASSPVSPRSTPPSDPARCPCRTVISTPT